MILQALYDYYWILESEGKIPTKGFEFKKPSFCVVLNKDGKIKRIDDLKGSGRTTEVPKLHAPRTRASVPRFLCDNADYALGLGSFENFCSFRELNMELVERVPGAEPFRKFLLTWNPYDDDGIFEDYREIMQQDKGIVVFQIKGDSEFLHEKQAVKDLWQEYYFDKQKEGQPEMFCLITGEHTKIRNLHPKVSGIGDQGSAPLISFNENAFVFDGSTPHSSPIGIEAAEAYSDALSYLADNQETYINIAGTKIIFWAKNPGNNEENFFSLALTNKIPNTETDWELIGTLRDLFDRGRKGEEIRGELPGIDENAKFYVLGIERGYRPAIQFFHVNDFGEIVEKVWQHHRDMALVKNYESDPDIIPIRQILLETCPTKTEKKVIPPSLSRALLDAVLTGSMYPRGLLEKVLRRIQKGEEGGEYVKASIIKAYLNRKNRLQNTGRREIKMGLDYENHNVGYLLGRLFAVVEVAQKYAINPQRSIKEKKIATASKKPNMAFPQILGKLQHYVKKIGNNYYDKQAENILQHIEEIPVNLDIEEQGEFFLGYYHQKKHLYTPKEEKEKEVVSNE